MKKLSVNKTDSRVSYRFKSKPSEYLFADCFSGFNIDGTLVRGACVNCRNKSCLKYAETELKSKVFSSFRNNSSNRVCPVNAIDENGGFVFIDQCRCIKCGLCLHRCPFAAIQFDLKKNTYFVNSERTASFESCSDDEMLECENALRKLPRNIQFAKISKKISEFYTKILEKSAKQFPDISEIIVRNTLVNLGSICNANAQGNNHVRIEFFAEHSSDLIIGESLIDSFDPVADTKARDILAVPRRILDDLAVLVGRYNFAKNDIIPLAVVNGLPNKRTDYYEIISDIENVLNVKISTVTYHILFVLNLFNVRLNRKILESFYVNRKNVGLQDGMKKIIPEISRIDDSIDSVHYVPYK